MIKALKIKILTWAANKFFDLMFWMIRYRPRNEETRAFEKMVIAAWREFKGLPPNPFLEL